MSDNENCTFCKIVKGEISADFEHVGEGVFAFKDIDPLAKIHLLVVPKKHIGSFLEIKEEDKDLLWEMVKIIQELIERKGISQTYRIVFNGGKYQHVPHLHWHLLGD
ncbi:MAG: hypothetical protein A2Y57_02330 [Candidatus Woykebacteria bacterium RBG_13_40_7b]|uniref:HIT domain-containing protein n=1 Tax=Candidatus Woykebacteria bacterium RBG_13_40_7b TaxID=1802594 RepID=A0A1G1WBE7_9BACT|nr:MAG: hypothetical protein A2Y57_02330 [Candidatus Woykebacteria bacterium RBG_13_40_7b]